MRRNGGPSDGAGGSKVTVIRMKALHTHISRNCGGTVGGACRAAVLAVRKHYDRIACIAARIGPVGRWAVGVKLQRPPLNRAHPPAMLPNRQAMRRWLPAKLRLTGHEFTRCWLCHERRYRGLPQGDCYAGDEDDGGEPDAAAERCPLDGRARPPVVGFMSQESFCASRGCRYGTQLAAQQITLRVTGCGSIVGLRA